MTDTDDILTRDRARARTPTGDLPQINGSSKREVRVSVSVMIAFVGMLVGVASFAANYVFVTKTELADRTAVNSSGISDVRETVARFDGKIEVLDAKISGVAKAQEEYQAVQRDMDENLRRLLISRGVRPVPAKRAHPPAREAPLPATPE